MRHAVTILTLILLGGIPPDNAAGQSALEWPPALPHSWADIPWSVEVGISTLLDRRGAEASPGLTADPAVRATLVLPRRTAVEVRYAPQPLETGGHDELELAARTLLLGSDRDHRVDLAVEGRVATGTEQALGGLTAARWLGPLRLAATAGALADLGAGGDARAVAGAGAVLHPAPGRMAIALAGDAATTLGGAERGRVAWSAGLQVGLAYTPHTLSLFLTNAGNSLAGRYQDSGSVRLGVELTGQLPLGRFLGLYPDRRVAGEAVQPAPRAQPVVEVAIREYRYLPARIEIHAGTAVRWSNEDDVIHTATAHDGAWDSGGLERGESWTATFSEPGIYPYYCGPHPYMRGVVIVR